MTPHLLLVKNMVCHRCVLAVEDILTRNQIPFLKVIFGEIHLVNKPDTRQKEILSKALENIGFELIDNHMSGLIEKIKMYVIRKARNEERVEEKKLNLSNYLSNHLNYEYTHLSSLFSSVEGRTIENLYIEQRIEKAKELLIYGTMTLSEIAFELNYSSTAHLSSQFKKVTGLTPSYFKKVGALKRKALDKI
jgi:AraC family transcriptional regulator